MTTTTTRIPRDPVPKGQYTLDENGHTFYFWCRGCQAIRGAMNLVESVDANGVESSYCNTCGTHLH